MKIYVINGPNLNMLGLRNSVHYGNLTLREINKLLRKTAGNSDCTLEFFQSNHEGKIIDFLQGITMDKKKEGKVGILINPGALTHYSIALRDALIDTNIPVVEVHLSDINKREHFRVIDVIKDAAIKRFMGKKEKSYIEGLQLLIKHLKNLP